MPPESWRQRTRPPSDLGGPLPQRRRFDGAANQSTSGRAQQAAIQAAYQEILPLMGEDVLDTYHVLDSAERPGEDDDPLSQQLADLIREGNEADGGTAQSQGNASGETPPTFSESGSAGSHARAVSVGARCSLASPLSSGQGSVSSEGPTDAQIGEAHRDSHAVVILPSAMPGSASSHGRVVPVGARVSRFCCPVLHRRPDGASPRPLSAEPGSASLPAATR